MFACREICGGRMLNTIQMIAFSVDRIDSFHLTPMMMMQFVLEISECLLRATNLFLFLSFMQILSLQHLCYFRYVSAQIFCDVMLFCFTHNLP